MSDNFESINCYAQQLQEFPRRTPKPLTAGQCRVLHEILDRISIMSEMTPDIQQAPKIRFHLLVLMGFYPHLRYRYEFPYPFPERAAALLKKFKVSSLGTKSNEVGSRENPVVLDNILDADDTILPTERIVEAKTAVNLDEEILPAKSVSRAKERESVNLDEEISPTESILVPVDTAQPIFGAQGIMRGIMIGADRRQYSKYSILAGYSKRNPNVIGHNNLKIGDWWPKQICALRDGAHGAKVSGISGTSTDGAYSIVLSGTYDNLDADRGDILYYCGSHSLVNKDPKTPTKSSYTEALRHSSRTKRPVRVLRSSRSNSPWSPSHGIRYDGLYVVTGEETKHNMWGGAYARFRMDRIMKQPPIDMTRPTNEEVELCKRVMGGP